MTNRVSGVMLPVLVGLMVLLGVPAAAQEQPGLTLYYYLSLIHISEPTRLLSISYAVFCLKKKKTGSCRE